MVVTAVGGRKGIHQVKGIFRKTTQGENMEGDGGGVKKRRRLRRWRLRRTEKVRVVTFTI